MSATNHTTTIELSQYISTDKPTYLTDYNGDMLKIDNAIAADREAITAAQSKANTADGKADANKTSIDTLGEQINGDPLDPSDTGLAGAVSANTGSINTINSLIGNGEPTTTDKTIIGAINELNADIVTPSTGIDARVTAAESAISTLGGEVGNLTNLTTTEKSSLVGAINEVNGKINALDDTYVIVSLANRLRIAADGVKTYSELLDELHSALATLIASLENDEVIKVTRLGGMSYSQSPVNQELILKNTDTLGQFESNRVVVSTAKAIAWEFVCKASGSEAKSADIATTGTTVNNISSSVAPNTDWVELYYDKYVLV